MAERTAIYVNNTDLASLGMIVESVEGWLDSPFATDRTTALPGRVGQIILAPETETAPRTITVTGVIKRTSLTACRTSIQQLKDLLSRGTIEVRFVDHLDRVVYARAQEQTITATQPQFLNPWSRVSFKLFCPDPLIYATQGTIIGVTANATQLPLGTAMVAPTIRIMGAATNPVLTYRGANGAVLKTQGFTFTLGGNDYLEINCEVFTIRKSIAGVQSIDMTIPMSGDWLSFDPQDGDPSFSSFPTLEVSAGSAEVLYRKTYL